MEKQNILLATTHWKNNSHHSNYSGFQRIAYYLIEYYNVTVVTWGVENQEIREDGIRVIILKVKGKTFFKKRYQISDFCKKQGTNYDLVYLLYADLGIRLGKHIRYISAVHNLTSIGKYESLKERIILWLKHKLIEPRVYKASSYIIGVSTNLQKILVNKYPLKARFLPHGIDVHFWNPSNIGNSNEHILQRKFKKSAICVGINGVNVDCVEQCIKHFPDVFFYLVGAFEFNYPNVKVLKGISDEALKKLYYQADVFFRPLDFATANNSLLEAMSMEKKIVITKVGGVTDYINEDYAYLAHKDNNNFVRVLSDCLRNINTPPRSEELRTYTIKKFSWEVIAKKTYELCLEL